jgi:hypothetical protein
VMTELNGNDKGVMAFGEMVSILWGDDNQAAAILLEQIWNEYIRDNRITLFCAYPMHYYEDLGHKTTIEQICRLHSCAVVPSS